MRAPAWRRCIGVLAAIWLANAGLVSAQQAETVGAGAPKAATWALVMTDGAGTEPRTVAGIAEQVEQALRAQGISRLTLATAQVFEESHSRASRELAPTALQALRRDVGQVLQHLAEGDWRAGLARLEAIEQLDGDAADLLREAGEADKLFGACVMAAFLAHEAGESQPAAERMPRCVAMYPGMQPSAESFPPAARLLFARHAQAVANAAVWLQIGTRGAQACEVRMNGVRLGTTPLRVRGYPGAARIQLTCGERAGRVHELELQPGEHTLDIDPGLEAAVRTSDQRVWLRYGGEAALHAHGSLDAIRIGESLDVDHVLQVELASQRRLRRLDVRARQASSAHVWTDGDALDALVGRVTADADTHHALPQVARSAPGAVPDRNAQDVPLRWDSYRTLLGHQASRGGAVVGAMLTGAGWVGSLALSATLLARRGDYRDAMEGMTVHPGASDGSLMLLAGVGSSLWLVPNLTLLPATEGVPAWAWLLGATGLGMVAGGAAHWAMAEHCGPREIGCGGGIERDPLLGRLLILHGLGPLSVPLTYLIAKAFGAGGPDAPKLEVRTSAHAGMLVFGGTL